MYPNIWFVNKFYWYTQLRERPCVRYPAELFLVSILHTVKWSYSSISNNSIEHESKLNGSKYCYVSLTIRLNISHLFALSLNVKQFYFTRRSDPVRCSNSVPELTRERWQWRGTLHSPKLQYYRNLTSKWFSVIFRTLIGGSYPSVEMQSVYSTTLADLVWVMDKY